MNAPGARPSVRRPGRRRAALGLAAALAVPALARAQSLPSADEVKAAYLTKFIGYVEWPPLALAPGDPVLIGVVDSDRIYAELSSTTADRVLGGRRIAVRRIELLGAGDVLHVLYLGSGSREAVRALALVRSRPVLTVGEGDQGLRDGCILAFVPADGRVRFQASLAAASEAGLRLSSRLLAVAERVVGMP
jgi:hypothetical protein